MVVNADGSGPASLIEWGEMPNVSPEGIIVFSSGIRYSDSPLSDGESEHYHGRLDPGYLVSRLPFHMYRYVNSVSKIFVMDVDGANIKELFRSVDVGASFPKFSPDGKKIAFKGTKEFRNQLWIMESNGNNPTQLTRRENIHYFCWRPDGKIIFTSEDESIWIMDCDGKNAQQLFLLEEDEYEPVWNCEGKKLAFGKEDDLYVMDSNGRNRRRLSELGGWIGGWSPDGHWIVFCSRKRNPNGCDIFIIRDDGKYEHRLTDLSIPTGHAGGDFDPCWLASLPSRGEMLMKLVRKLYAPITQLTLVLKSAMVDLVNTLNLINESKGS